MIRKECSINEIEILKKYALTKKGTQFLRVHSNSFLKYKEENIKIKIIIWAS